MRRMVSWLAWVGCVSAVAMGCGNEAGTAPESGGQSEGVGSIAVAAGALPFSPLAAAPAAPAFTFSQMPLVLNTPWGGRTTGVSINPANASDVIAATESGGLFHTTNGGTTWTHIDGVTPSKFADVRFSPNTSGVVIASAQGDTLVQNHGGILRSTDGGVTWSKPSTGDPTCETNPSAFGIAYGSGDQDVFVGTSCGLAVSHDAGATWTHKNPGASVQAVVAHPGIIDVFSPDGNHRSTDGGNSWSAPPPTAPIPALRHRFMPNVATHALASSPSSSSVLFITIYDERGPKFGGKLYESDDAGATWTDINAPNAANGRPTFVKTRPALDGDPSHYDLYYGDTVDTFRTTCVNQAGQQCTQSFNMFDTSARPIASGPWNGMEGPGSGHTDNMDLDFPSGSNCPAYLAGDGGVLTPSGCGDSAHWAVTAGWQNGYNALQVFKVTGQTLTANSDYYFGTQDNSLYASTDSGATFNGFGNEGETLEIPRHLAAPTGAGEILVTDTFWVMFDGSNFDGTSPRGAKGWFPPPGGDGEGPLVIEPGVYFQWGGDTLYLTVNPLPWLPTSAPTWTAVPGAVIADDQRVGHLQWSGTTANPVLFQAVVRGDGSYGLDRIDGARIGMATVGAIDAGLTNLGIGASSPANNPMFAVDPANPNHVLAADLGAQAMKVTRDGGTTWVTDAALTSAVTGNGQFRFSGTLSGAFIPPGSNSPQPVTSVSALAIDPSNGNRIVVGTDEAGVFASVDGGNSWAGVPGSAVASSLSSVFFDERLNQVLLSSYGRALWKLTLPPPSVCLFAGQTFDLADRDNVTSDLDAGSHLEVGSSARLQGNGTVGGGAFIRSNGVVTGNLTLGGTLSTQGPFTIGGTLSQNASPAIPALATKTFPVGTGTRSISSNVTLAPGNFGNVTVQAGQTVTFNAGTYNFASLNVMTDDLLVINGAVTINVQGSFQLGDRSRTSAGAQLTVYSDATSIRLGTDLKFNGTLVAPAASIMIFSRTVLTGCVGGQNVSFDTDITQTAGGQALPFNNPAPATCTDGVQDGGETGVDCGGPNCAPCPSPNVTTVVKVTSDWGAGYCAELDVTNPATVPTTNWSVSLNLNGSTITQTWNGVFSGSSGAITVGPGFDWNRIIPPGQTNTSVGFCAARPAPAGTAWVKGDSGSF